jgi:hypothetical protein
MTADPKARPVSVQDRAAFEAWISAPPYELTIERFPENPNQAWSGQYHTSSVQLAWESWQRALAQHPAPESDVPAGDSMPVVPEDVHWRPGHERLWNWFGMSRASWLTMPRAFMQAMPGDWQWRMAQLCEEWDAAWNWPDGMGSASVNQRVYGRMSKWPDYVLNYRHPDNAAIAALRATPPTSDARGMG